jgi:hypothetical protein
MKKFTRLWMISMTVMLSFIVILAQAQKQEVSKAKRMKTEASKTAPTIVKASVNLLGQYKMDEQKPAIAKEEQVFSSQSLVSVANGQSSLTDPKAPDYQVKGVLDCPPGSQFSQSAVGYGTGVTSENSTGNSVYQYFNGLTEDITEITFWGIRAVYNGGWAPCTEDPIDFQINFYGDNAGAPDLTNLLDSYSVTLTGFPTGEMFLGAYEVMRYSYPFATGLTLTDAWVMIQGGGDPDCWFLWMDSGTTGTLSFQDTGNGPAQTAYVQSLCLKGTMLDHDLAVSIITQPNSGTGLTSTEVVEIEIANNGANAESNFDVSYQIGPFGTPVVETYTGTINSGETALYQFTQTADLSTEGVTYDFTACTALSTDEDNSNDCTTKDVTHYPPVPNDECTEAILVGAGGYPETVNGTTYGSVVSCPGVLDWEAAWYEVTLPFNTNDLTVDYCGTSGMSTVGVVYYNSCGDCSAYVLYDNNTWYDCGGGENVALTEFNAIPGPATILFPVFVGHDGLDFTATFDVKPASVGCGDVDMGTLTPALTWDSVGYIADTTYYWDFHALNKYTYSFSSCTAGEDTYIRIYDADYNVVATADDNGPYCSGTTASIDWTNYGAEGTYYVSLAHYSCNNLENDSYFWYKYAEPCVVSCPPGATQEGEVCSDSINNGCNLTTPLFGSVTDGETICGNTWDDGTSRDTDWYGLDITYNYARVTVIAEAEIEMIFGKLQQTIPGVPGCGNITGSFDNLMSIVACTEDTLIFETTTAGTYYLFAGQSAWVGNDCPGSNYWFSVDVEEMLPPTAVIDPTSFSATLTPDATATGSLSIGNTGEISLTYDASIDFGSGTGTGTIALEEGFESGVFPPANWTLVQNSSPVNPETWQTSASLPHSGDSSAVCFYDDSYTSTQDEWLISPVMDLTGFTGTSLSFWWFTSYYWGVDPNNNSDIQVKVTTDGSTWTQLWTEDSVGVFDNWVYYQQVIDLTAYNGETTFQIAFVYYGYDGAQASVDDIIVQDGSPPVIGWLTLDGGTTASGSVASGDTDVLAVGFNSGGLEPGVYNATIDIETNEPTKTQNYSLPATLTVVANGYNVTGTLMYANSSSTIMNDCGISLMNGTIDMGAAVTGNDGTFAFSNVPDGSYTYRASSTKERGGTQVGDMNVVVDHILGSSALTGIQFASADINVDGSVNVNDYNGMVDEILGSSSGWAAPDWIFDNPTIPVAGGDAIQDLFALCSGDPDGSYTPPYTCKDPTDLGVGIVTGTTAELVWTSNSGLSDIIYGLTGFDPTAGGTYVTGVTSSYMLSGLTMATGYDFYVRDDCGAYVPGSYSEFAGPYTFTTGSTPYCVAGALYEDEFIETLTVGTISDGPFVADGLTYHNYTATSTDMAIGTGYPITVTNGSYYTGDQCVVWVDWNGDLDFEDAGESFVLTDTNGDGSQFDGTITPPAGAIVGSTQMRIRLLYIDSPLPCGNSNYGEVFDYSVNVTP